MDSSNALGISVDWLTKPFNDAMDEITRVDGSADRATRYALRETGRQMGRIARAKAPSYKGTDPRPVRGALRRSIKNAREMPGSPETGYELKVGVFGGSVTRERGKGARGVTLYAPKMEAKYGYMAAAFGEGGSVVTRIYEDAIAKALAKYS